ncbi:WD domain, G-beta repeat protein, partial [Teladorsagia circumcincta]
FYVASGDSAGNVRIWDTTQSTHILKATYQVFSGSVRDIAWNDDSKRIAAVGEGRERFGHVFLFDTGTSNGNLSGQSRPMSSIDFRPTRPFRLVSGSEDNTVAIFEGPPFKFKTVVLFEGTEGTKTGELVDDSVKGGAAHSGSVFGLAWSPCGQRIATASGDKTVKIWNVPERALEKVISFGDSTEDQQIGISWSSKALVSVSLAGFLSFIDPAGNITKVVHGHNKGITSLALTSCKQWLITADFEGHINSVQSKCIKLPSQPQGMASTHDGNLTVIACYKNVLVFEDEKLSADLNVAFNPSCAAISGNLVAVGGQVVPYSVEDFKTIASKEWTFHTAKVNCVAWSPDNRHLATGGLDTNIIVWDLERSGEHPIIIR